jgi:hypothetical protein
MGPRTPYQSKRRFGPLPGAVRFTQAGMGRRNFVARSTGTQSERHDFLIFRSGRVIMQTGDGVCCRRNARTALPTFQETESRPHGRCSQPPAAPE